MFSSLTSVEKHGRLVFQRAWSEWYFLANPRSFVLTHLPLEGDQILPEKQGLLYPITSAKEWANMALVSPMAIEYGVKTISHPEAVVKTTSGEVSIEYECDFPLSQFVKVWQRERRENNVRERTSDSVSNQVRLVLGSTTRNTVLARFARPGEFRVKVFGEVRLGHPDLARTQCLLDYVIKNSGRSPSLPVGAPCSWGVRRDFRNAGFKVLEPREPITDAVKGRARVRVRLPTSGYFPNKFNLTFSDGEGRNEAMNDCVIASRDSNTATYIVQCPLKGEYLLQLSVKYDKPSRSGEGFQTGASFLVRCSTPAQHVHYIDTSGCLPGPNNNFYEQSFVTSATSTFLRAHDGVVRLFVKHLASPRVRAQLVKADRDHQQISHLVSVRALTTEISSISVRLGERRGVYLLMLYSSVLNNVNQTYTGCFVISNERLT